MVTTLGKTMGLIAVASILPGLALAAVVKLAGLLARRRQQQAALLPSASVPEPVVLASEAGP